MGKGGIWFFSHCLITLARFPYFATFGSGRGGWPPGVSKLRVIELSGKNSGFLFSTRDWWYVLWSLINIWPIYESSKVKFSENRPFSPLHAYSSKLMNFSDKEPSPACSPLNSEQSTVLLQLIDGIFVEHRVPEVNSVTLIAKITWGQTKPTALIDME